MASCTCRWTGRFPASSPKVCCCRRRSSFDGENVIVGELTGRVTILDKAGAVVARVGANTERGVGINRVHPDQWKTGLVVAPHGVALNTRGDLFVSGFTTFGRAHRFNKK